MAPAKGGERFSSHFIHCRIGMHQISELFVHFSPAWNGESHMAIGNGTLMPMTIQNVLRIENSGVTVMVNYDIYVVIQLYDGNHFVL